MPTVNWPWAILLCRFADVPAVPHDRDYYERFYTVNGTGGVCDYWRAVSCGTLDLTGSRVFGWLDMTHVKADVNGLVLPGDRGQLVQWGRDAAAAAGVNLGPFNQVLVVHNYGVDHGAAGNGILIVDQNASLCEFGFICHEMGHGFGLPHSWSANPDREYGDKWDVMSYASSTAQFPITFETASGLATVGLNARNLDALGAVPAGRRWSASSPDFSAALTLDPLNQPLLGSRGYLVATIPPHATQPARPSQSQYTIEFHQRAGWDRAIAQAAVSVREIRTDGHSYLQPGLDGQLLAGQQYATPDPKVFTQVSAIDEAAGTAALRVWDLPDGCLRKEDRNRRVYLIEQGTKRWVTSSAVLDALGKTWADVRSVPDGALRAIPDGPDVNLITVSVTPHPMPIDQPVTITVHAIDITTGADIAGPVLIDETPAGTTGTPFTHTFHPRHIGIPPELIYPVGIVRVPGFPDLPIDFGFPETPG